MKNYRVETMKYLSIVLAAFLMSGCTQSTQPQEETKSHQELPKLFQSVDEKDAVLVQEGKNKRYCARCGMDLVKYYKTSHAAEHEAKQHQYCSIHCLEDHLGEGITLKNPRVVDVTTLKLISVVDAYYVVGSKMRGTMSKVSKYAFGSLEEAKKFQALYGGELMDFNHALLKAKEDFKYYK